MRKAVVTEWLLSRVVGHDRAAAIVGDLLEVSELRGKLWFWSAFLRIWVSLTWRRPVAWIGACACGILLVELWQYQWRSLSLHHFTPGGQAAPLPLIALLAGIAAPLWFALPYGILRFGLRDRFTQLCCAMFLLTTVTFFFCFMPWILPLFALLTVMTVAGMLFSPVWRRPMIVLATTLSIGLAGAVITGDLMEKVFAGHPAWGRVPRLMIVRLTTLFALWILTTVCSRMHSLLLSRPAAADRTIA